MSIKAEFLISNENIYIYINVYISNYFLKATY